MRPTIDPVKATSAMPGVSEGYGFVNSQKILDVFQSKGWNVDSVQTSKVRNASKDGFQKHVVWLKNDQFKTIPGLSKDNESIPRLCLVNSHDLSSSLAIFFGIIRIACENQLVTGNVLRFFRTVHSKNVIKRLDNGIEYMSEGIPELIDNVQRLQSIQMNQDQRFQYAKAMIDARLENTQNVLSVDYNVIDRIVRLEDKSQDAYTVMNRVQEYVIRGGIPYSYTRQTRDPVTHALMSERIVHTKTRKVAAISTQLKLNQALSENIFKVVA